MFRTVSLQSDKSDFTIHESLSGRLDLKFTARDD